MNKNNFSTMKSPRLSEEFNLKNATNIGEANLLADYTLDVLKLPQIFRDYLTLQKAPNAILSARPRPGHKGRSF